jgi:hypothetical protein
MENEKKFSAFLVPFLVFAVVGLTALDIYQNRIIERQRYEMRWLVTHAKITGDINANAPSQSGAGTADAPGIKDGQPVAAQPPAQAPAKP